MALLIEKQTPFGIPASYWRIISAQIDFGRNEMKVFMAGYASEDARNAGADPLIQEQVNFDAQTFAPDQPRNIVYAEVKRLDGWSGAADS